MPLTYLYNDGDIFAVYKPSGIHSVKLPKGGGASIADELLSANPALIESSKNPGDAGLINRLDVDTSGILLGATTRCTWEALYALALSGEIHKTYAALVEGEVKETLSITSYIGSPNRGAKKVKVYEQEPAAWARALEGTTTYTAHSYLQELDASLVLVSASPARRHQVRAHAAHLGHPLVGDSLYGSTRALMPITPDARSFFLHASALSFIHPCSGRQISIESQFEQELSLARQ